MRLDGIPLHEETARAPKCESSRKLPWWERLGRSPDRAAPPAARPRTAVATGVAQKSPIKRPFLPSPQLLVRHTPVRSPAPPAISTMRSQSSASSQATKRRATKRPTNQESGEAPRDGKVSRLHGSTFLTGHGASIDQSTIISTHEALSVRTSEGASTPPRVDSREDTPVVNTQAPRAVTLPGAITPPRIPDSPPSDSRSRSPSTAHPSPLPPLSFTVPVGERADATCAVGGDGASSPAVVALCTQVAMPHAYLTLAPSIPGRKSPPRLLSPSPPPSTTVTVKDNPGGGCACGSGATSAANGSCSGDAVDVSADSVCATTPDTDGVEGEEGGFSNRAYLALASRSLKAGKAGYAAKQGIASQLSGLAPMDREATATAANIDTADDSIGTLPDGHSNSRGSSTGIISKTLPLAQNHDETCIIINLSRHFYD